MADIETTSQPDSSTEGTAPAAKPAPSDAPRQEPLPFDTDFLEADDSDDGEWVEDKAKPAEEPEAKPQEEGETPEPKPTEPEPEKPEEPEPEEDEEDEEETAKRTAAIRESFLAEIEQSYGNSLTPEEKEAVGEKMAQLLPRLAARVHLDVYDAAVRTLFSQLPGAVLAFEHQRTQMTAAEDVFYEKWPDLKDTKHREAVSRIAKAYRTAYPDASMEQAIEDVGLIARQKLGLQSSKTVSPKANAGNGHVSREARREVLPPSPAGAGSAHPTSPKTKNVFEELAEFELEDY
jgi:hypothetical protein